MRKQGFKIRVTKKNKGEIDKVYIGKIIKIYKNYMSVLLDNNRRESFNVADIVNPSKYKLQVRKGKEWVNITKDMIPEKMGKFLK
ncbi:hypothetical protein [Clostridium baratii]|uniref:hypothetical protein n=1 Tax=Clostridium baratii TaxID=1561 RepID=UPI0030D35C98